jgi:excisionase family DNA binding protein
MMAEIAVDKDYYTPEEIAERLKVHKRTVLRWIAGGTLRAYRFGAQSGMLRVAKDDLARFMEERETRPPYPKSEEE